MLVLWWDKDYSALRRIELFMVFRFLSVCSDHCLSLIHSVKLVDFGSTKDKDCRKDFGLLNIKVQFLRQGLRLILDKTQDFVKVSTEKQV